MKKAGNPLEIKISISTWKGRRTGIKTPYHNLGPDWGSNLIDVEGDSGESQLYQSTSQKKKINFHRPLYEGWNFNSGNYLFTTDTK